MVGLLWTRDRPRRRDFYLITYNTHKTETSMLPAGFEPEIPGNEWLQTLTLDRSATRMDQMSHYSTKYQSKLSCNKCKVTSL